jgi:hypothetical protein
VWLVSCARRGPASASRQRRADPTPLIEPRDPRRHTGGMPLDRRGRRGVVPVPPPAYRQRILATPLSRKVRPLLGEKSPSRTNPRMEAMPIFWGENSHRDSSRPAGVGGGVNCRRHPPRDKTAKSPGRLAEEVRAENVGVYLLLKTVAICDIGEGYIRYCSKSDSVVCGMQNKGIFPLLGLLRYGILKLGETAFLLCFSLPNGTLERSCVPSGTHTNIGVTHGH